MLNLKATSQLRLFNDFADRWQKIAGCELVFLSSEGQILSNLNGKVILPLDGADIIKQISTDKATYFRYANEADLLAVPLLQGNETIGYLLAINAREQDTFLLTWWAEVIAARLGDTESLQGMMDELISAWNQLALIYHVNQNLPLTFSDLITSLKSILKEIQRVIETADGFIILKRATAVDCITDATTVPKSYFSDTLFNVLLNSNEVILAKNLVACQEIWPDVPETVENLLATKVAVIEEETSAVLVLLNKTSKFFTAGDIKLLSALSQQIGMVIKNFLVHQKIVLRERFRHELEIAAKIQETILPPKLPQAGGLSIAVSSIPASEVGGDFYDFITLDEQRFAFIIGDVAGKGITAAMLTSLARTMLRVETIRREPPHVVIQQANNILYQNLDQAELFVTAFIAVVDTYHGTMSYASAGHMPALLWRADTRAVEQLRATTLPIGITGYEENSTQLVPLHAGDTLVLFTDGLIETQSPNGDWFGLPRLEALVKAKATEPPEKLQHHIQSEVTKFRRNALNLDDATVLVVKMLPQTESAVPQNISTILKIENYTYPADIVYLRDISEQIIKTCRESPFLPPGPSTEDFIYLIELAISEICTNIVRHAYKGRSGDIRIAVTLLSNGIQLDFYDNGVGFDPNLVPRPKSGEYKEGGYGLHIIRQIMDVVSYDHHSEKGNHWHMIKLLPPK